ncbi:hypothetical protein Van01_61510 [Micromonospora andamanensis]|uniref:Uncharacterized protein n=1 Tax=Micromonospora andamanensis TaxID=1287068 RepID=A0ABQ4I4W9_9ACTN|nr:hypothetical protein Van01_61510 [Micromonospora andamanensis]
MVVDARFNGLGLVGLSGGRPSGLVAHGLPFAAGPDRAGTSPATQRTRPGQAGAGSPQGLHSFGYMSLSGTNRFRWAWAAS